MARLLVVIFSTLGGGITPLTVAALPVVEFATDTLKMTELDGLVPIPIVVSGLESSNRIRLRINLVGGTATRGEDFYFADFEADLAVPSSPEPQTLQPTYIAVTDDGAVESEEIVELRLEVRLGATLGPRSALTCRLQNSPPTLRVIGGNGSEVAWSRFWIERRGDLTPVSVRWETNADGTAVPWVDFEPGSGEIHLPEGSRGEELVITALDNGRLDGERTIGLRLFQPSDNAVIAQASGHGFLQDNELLPSQDWNLRPGGVGALTISGWGQPIGLPDGGAILRWDSDDRVCFRYDAEGHLRSLIRWERGPLNNAQSAPDGSLYFSGGFSAIAGKPRSGLVRLRSDGQPDLDFTPPKELWEAFSPPRILLARSNGTVVVAMAAKRSDVEEGWQLVALRTDGTLDPTFQPTPPGVFEEEPEGAREHTAGSFLVWNRSRLLRILPNGVLDTQFRPPSGIQMVSYAEPPMHILADGRLLIFRLTPEGYVTIVRLQADGTLDGDFAPKLFRSIFAQLNDGRWLLGSNDDFSLRVLRPDFTPDAELSGVFAQVGSRFMQHSSIYFQNLPDGRIWFRPGNHVLRVNHLPKTAVALVQKGVRAFGDTRPEVYFGDTWQPEVYIGSAGFQIAVRRFGETTGSARVRVRTVDGTAHAGVDYEPVDEVIEFEPLETERLVQVPIQEWPKAESSRRFVVELREAIGFEETGPPVTAVIPGSKLSVRIPAAEPLPGGWRHLVVDLSPPGYSLDRYQVQASNDLRSWSQLNLLRQSGQYQAEVLDPDAATAPVRYYRAFVRQ